MNKISTTENSPAEDGYLDVAEFIDVVRYDKKKYPNGIRYYKVHQSLPVGHDLPKKRSSKSQKTLGI